MNNNNMNYIMEHLENAVTELEKIMQVMLPTEYAVYVDMDQEQVELARTAYEYQFMISSVSSDLSRLRSAAKNF